MKSLQTDYLRATDCFDAQHLSGSPFNCFGICCFNYSELNWAGVEGERHHISFVSFILERLRWNDNRQTF